MTRISYRNNILFLQFKDFMYKKHMLINLLRQQKR